jgi:tetratricopeptide (TPR) repeat protein
MYSAEAAASDVYKEGQDAARKLVARSPDDPNAHYHAGRLDKNFGELQYQRAKYREALDLLEQAEKSLTKSLQLKPRNPAARNALCDVKRWQSHSTDRLGRRDQARQLLQAGINERRALVDEFPSVPLFLIELAKDYGYFAQFADTPQIALDRSKLGAQHMKSAYAANPNDIYTNVFLAHAYCDWEASLGALERHEECLAVRREARAHFDALRSRPQFAAAFAQRWAWHMAQYAALPEPADVVRLARHAVEIDPHHWIYWHTLGIALYRAEDYRESIEALTRSLKSKASKDGYSFFWLAMAHLQLGEGKKGREWLNKGIRWVDANPSSDSSLHNYQVMAKWLMGDEPIPVTEADWNIAFHEFKPADQSPNDPPPWKEILSSPPLHQEKARTIDFFWGVGSPAPGVPEDHFAVVATTSIELTAGNYTLQTLADDGVRVFLDGKVIIDNPSVRPASRDVGTAEVESGKHDIRIEFFDMGAPAALQFGIFPTQADAIQSR